MITLEDKFLGCVLGHAIGDALGYQVEFDRLEDIRDQFPTGIEFRPHRRNGRVQISDDTQMSLAVAEGLIETPDLKTEAEETFIDDSAQRIVPHLLAWEAKPLGGHRAPGNACLRGVRQLRAGVPWDEAGHPEDGGCGAVMRSAVYGLRFYMDPSLAAKMAAAHAKMTHGHPMAAASSAAIAVGVAYGAHWQPQTDPETGMGSAATLAEIMVTTASSIDPGTGRMLHDAVKSHLTGRSSDDFFDQYRGWAGHEAIAAGLFAFLKGSTDPRPYERAVKLGAETPGDSDSIACLAGALAGASYGVQSIPSAWINTVEFQAEITDTASRLYKVSVNG